MIFHKLDLDEFIEQFSSYFARKKPIFLQGDSKLHESLIKELSKYEFKTLENVSELDNALAHLSKQGILHKSDIFEFVKIISYINYLQKVNFGDRLGEWLDKIVMPSFMQEVVSYFDEKGEFKSSIDERFLKIDDALRRIKEEINTKIRQLISSKKIEPFLVDRQVHFINDQEALLLRGGFNHVIKGTVIARSSGGFFYVAPESVNALKHHESALLDEKQSVIYEYCKKISNEFSKSLLFLKFLNKEFDRFDHYSARVLFAREKNLEFIIPNGSSEIKLSNFSHPALNNPKPINVDFKGNVLMITGVNAGGKTMLLKSILSAALLAKYLIPFSIDAANSSIGSFKNIEAIIEDPQNASNDISTFAGRMLSFSKLFGSKNILVGVDEIELGTDSDEASSLFFVIISKLISNNIKIIITTHHKRLASLLATKEGVELQAAIYDEKLQRPTFEFLKGTIGKSYAFETALRYGIPASIVGQAKQVYGEDKENLNDLIQKNIDLELSLKKQILEAEEKLKKADNLNEKLKDQKDELENEYKKRFSKLESEFLVAIELAKKAAKSSDFKSIHQALNEAQNAKKILQNRPKIEQNQELKVGDRVKYNKTKGVIVSIKKDFAIILSGDMNLRVPLSELKSSSFVPLKQNSKIKIQAPKSGSVKLDLHGLRSDEAIEKLDKFLSDALLSGFDEVLIYHGIGTGKLSHAVNEFLKIHPRVIEFNDAPPSMGGFGAKVVKL